MHTNIELSPRFHYAYRRCVFYLLLFLGWTLVGIFLFSTSIFLSKETERNKYNIASLDAKRSDLLNVLWAETITNVEEDWSLLANQKLEIYEKVFLQSHGINIESSKKSLSASLHKTFSISSTIGAININEYSSIGKLMVFFYCLIGTPLFLKMTGQLSKMITSIWQGKILWIIALTYLFTTTIIYDIFDQDNEDLPFFDGFFSLFIQFATIGEINDQCRRIWEYLLLIIGVAFLTAIFYEMQKNIEKIFQPLELLFNRIYGNFERWITERNSKRGFISNTIEEENEEELSDADD